MKTDERLKQLEDRLDTLEKKDPTPSQNKVPLVIHQSQIVPGVIKERHLVVTSTIAAGDILYCDGNNNFIKLPIGTVGQKLTVAGGIPTWA